MTAVDAGTVAKGESSRDESDMAVFERITRARYTCRAYRPEPVAREDIDRLLLLSQRAANWCNTQAWQVLVTEGEVTRKFSEAIYAHAASNAPMTPDFPFPGGYVGVYDQRRKDVGKALYGALGIPKGDREASRQQMLENFRLFGAPHIAIVTTEAEIGVYGVLDSGLYIQQFLLGATAMGLGTTAQAAIAQYSGFVREHFGIPEHRRILCGISFGWPDHDQPVNQFRTQRAPMEEVVQYRSA